MIEFSSFFSQQKDVYRCAQVKFRSKVKCDSVVRLVYESDELFTLEHNMLKHSCKNLDKKHKSKPVMSEKVVQEVEKLFIAKIRKPRKVLASLRAIKQRNPNFYDTEPSLNQIKYQIKKLKEKVYGKGEISMTQLESFLQDNSNVPDDDDDAFVIGYRIRYAETDLESSLEVSNNSQNNSVNEKRSFWYICSTKRLLKLASKVDILCCDTTFKFLWAGYPAILIGTVDMQKQFHSIAFGFTSIEDSNVFNEVFDVRHL